MGLMIVIDLENRSYTHFCSSSGNAFQGVAGVKKSSTFAPELIRELF